LGACAWTEAPHVSARVATAKPMRFIIVAFIVFTPKLAL